MGLASWALGRIKAPLGRGFKLGKLFWHCVHSLPRPIPIAEKIAVFVLGQVNGKACLAYYAGRIAWGKRRSSKQAARALDVLSSYDFNEDGTVDAQEVSVALSVTSSLSYDKEVLRARAGYVFVSCMLERMAVDSGVNRAYRTPTGRFDANSCLKNFYSSSLNHKMVAAVKKDPNITPELRTSTFMPIALDIWLDIRTKLRNDVIDFVML
mmetsp:Transcript_35368/g.89557  ORF Transcript_35368/g.89557 Transcript_35368/m.89557 type:complete len:210 (-) Transcript_35368:447-1076(-)|eukprot:CAMPEP_0202869022 /NCGR_PEP_ID=MMETSP1391-20130828/11630_1 /ASSEMBLY_ACC=CAM_ASM_000867 /TAXON_ID=1034604 /ORGANISM="Chlamydomonas leiostraca, Strain SAG 11-49" /LENGTH=209 /DNA_ID=CAMNT_0049549269 /DNA_START=77 /DNA_END=706 /DNA_ORIENTATION=+